MMHNALQLNEIDLSDPFGCLQGSSLHPPSIAKINPKLQSLPPLSIPLPNFDEPDEEAPDSPPPSSTYGVAHYTFEKVATAICMYRVAMLNFEASNAYQVETNRKAVNKTVKTLYDIFDHYDYLSELTRQLVGVFLKELYFESTKGKKTDTQSPPTQSQPAS